MTGTKETRLYKALDTKAAAAPACVSLGAV